ncbi:NADP-dependent oxidoreductase [Kribbella qitaiheensis]|uniref:NADP-dependent oxidoreductase n=1 Tax=Kribbella qitaiheensis TaxID=1544730 RepID=A0A7G6WSE0_9ACTN|nr:NADP-dependent oxidoreductase [Kribbella qitaiheensis]QNE16905.1 NADP-dependent oxidoreductase [Kribbella qitaiheensis]
MSMNEKMMLAVVAERSGGPEVLELREVERPTPGLTEILVRVHAAGVNPTDWKSRTDNGDEAFPAILGYDVAGVIEEVGFGVTWLRVGDEVLGMPKFPLLPGGYAQYVVAQSRQFVRKPKALSFEQAAGLPLAALTAWQGLVETGQLRSGQRVLVHAAAGGVGHLAVQIAKSLGAYVIGTASAPKHEFVRSLGADEVIDYRNEDFADVLRTRPVDVVFDPIAGDTSLRSLEVIKDGGSLVSILPVDEAAAAEARRRGIHAEFTLVEPDRLALTAITELVDQGKLRVEIDSVFPLAETAAAHRRGETNQATGKIVLRVMAED